MVTTDNAANLKNAFLIVNDNDNDVDVENDDNEDEEDEVNILKQWTSHHSKFEGWVGCAGHQIQLVVNDDFKEQKSYHQVQAVFAKAKSISALLINLVILFIHYH